MDTVGIRAFVMIARTGNITRAAERLHVSQPALSQQLKRLEERLDASLFVRSARGLELTEQGRRLLPAAEQTLAALEALDALAKGMRRAVQGTLRIGTIIDPEFLRLGALLGWLRQHHPGIALELRHGMSGTMTSSVAQGHLDVTYTLGSPTLNEFEPTFQVLPLARFQYRVIAPPAWRDRVLGKSWTELLALPWLATPPESVHHRLLGRIFADCGRTPPVAAEVDLEPSMLALVRAGVGLALARDTLARTAAHSAEVVIADRVTVPAGLGFIAARGTIDQPTIQAAQSGIRAVWTLPGPEADDQR